MRVAVLGPTGSLGSHICVELLGRGHEVVGVSRAPEELGEHVCYRPLKLDISTADIEQLIAVMKDAEVVVNAYNPPIGPDLYKNLLETTRRVVKAVKSFVQKPQGPYLITIGGMGSLELPGQPHTTVLDSREWWLAMRNVVADSAAATRHMADRLGGSGPLAEGVQAYRDARLAAKAGNPTEKERQTIRELEEAILYGPNPIPVLPLAARAALMMFEGNESFKWSFVSPPAGYRPGPRMGKYQIWMDELPMLPAKATPMESDNGNDIVARVLGISVADLAIAVADEVEKQEKRGRHWTAVGELGDDQPRESHTRI